MQHSKTLGALLVSALLVACGGGGGGSTEASISGFAQKGILKNATVTAYAVNADGTVSSTAAKASETDDNGDYTLSGLVAGQKYVVKVTPNAKTIHIDEIAGEQVLSDDFVLSAVAQPSAGTANKASVTPFSHQVVEAARTAAGGLSAANVEQAQSVVTQQLGFNPASVEKTDALLKTMLTAVSQMATDGALGCTGTAAQNITCVTRNLAAATKTTTTKLEFEKNGSKVDASATFVAAIQKTLPKASQESPQVQTLVQNTIKQLECTDCKPVKPLEASAASAVDKVKGALASISADLTTLLKGGIYKADSKAKLNAEALKFKPVVDYVESGALTQTQVDLRALLLGVEFWREIGAGTVQSLNKSASFGQLEYGYGLRRDGVFATGCSLYTDATLATQVTTNADISKVGAVACSARYARVGAYNSVTNVTEYTEWRHLFAITVVSAAEGKLAYESWANRLTSTCKGSALENRNGLRNADGTACDRTESRFLDLVDGKRVASKGEILANGVTKLTIKGDLPGNFKRASTTPFPASVKSLVEYETGTKATWNMTASIDSTDAEGEPVKVSLDGEVNKFLGETKIASMTLAKGSFADSSNASAKLTITASVFGAENTASAVGVLEVGAAVEDKSKTRSAPSTVKFTGTLSNTNPKTAAVVDFLKGALTMTITNLDKVDASLSESPTNAADMAVNFTGSLTATGQPRIELAFDIAGKDYDLEGTAKVATWNFSRYVDGAKNGAVTLTAERTAATATTAATETAKLTEATSGLSISIKKGDKIVDVLANGTKVGVIDLSTSLITFSDQSVISLDLGL